MNKRGFRDLHHAHRAAHHQVEEVRRPDIIKRYLPSDFDVEKAGYPSAIEVLLQWEMRHRGCIYAARELFLDKPLPRTAEERIEKWYICLTLIECATRAFDDLNAIIDWYTECWSQDEQALRVAMSRHGIKLCPDPTQCEVTLHSPVSRDKPDETAPFSGLP